MILLPSIMLYGVVTYQYDRCQRQTFDSYVSVCQQINNFCDNICKKICTLPHLFVIIERTPEIVIRSSSANLLLVYITYKNPRLAFYYIKWYIFITPFEFMCMYKAKKEGLNFGFSYNCSASLTHLFGSRIRY